MLPNPTTPSNPPPLLLTITSDKAYAALLQYAETYPTGAAMTLAYPSTGNYPTTSSLQLVHYLITTAHPLHNSQHPPLHTRHLLLLAPPFLLPLLFPTPHSDINSNLSLHHHRHRSSVNVRPPPPTPSYGHLPAR